MVDGSKSSIEDFYPRSPCGERPNNHAEQQAQRDFYPRSPCGERPVNGQNIKRRQKISIHALLAESDQSSEKSTPEEEYFYPRSPCGERPIQSEHCERLMSFLSTLSLRRATLGAGKSCDVCGISIHALLAESDSCTAQHT